MFKSSIISILSSFLLVSVAGFGFRGFHFEGIKEPLIKNGRSLSEKWIQQPLDHFDVRNNRTWKMRFYENDQFFNGNGPIFIMLGGEWEISPSFLQTGLLFENAKAHKGMMYYTEHRYYGKSRPVKDTSPENLLFLNVDQALADIAYFIETKKKELNIMNGTVILFGGSYSGNMAAWARIKYPHFVDGAVASSAPVRAKADFHEYYEVVAASLARYDKKCIENVKEAFTVVERLILNVTGLQELQKEFNLCNTPDLSVKGEIGWFMNSIAEIFAEVVQYNKVDAYGKSDITKICDKMTDSSISSPFKRLASLINVPGSKCKDWSYKTFLNIYTNTSWESKAAESIMRLWYYQTCTEYGYYQTSNSKNNIFGSLFTVDFFIQICSDLYGNYYDTELVDESVRRTNVMYGSDRPDVKNVIFTNGDIDPWHPLSVLDDLNEHSPAILINGSSHTADLGSDQPGDVEGLTKARQRIRSIIKNWINAV